MENVIYLEKTVKDSATAGKLYTPMGLRTTSLGRLKNLDFSDFWLPSWILAEMENAVYLENCKR